MKFLFCTILTILGLVMLPGLTGATTNVVKIARGCNGTRPDVVWTLYNMGTEPLAVDVDPTLSTTGLAVDPQAEQILPGHAGDFLTTLSAGYSGTVTLTLTETSTDGTVANQTFYAHVPVNYCLVSRGSK